MAIGINSKRDTGILPIFDGHNDLLLRLYREGRDREQSFFKRNDHGHIDLPRCREGGFAGGFFAVYVPPPPDDPSVLDASLIGVWDGELPPPLELGYAQEVAMSMTALLFRLEAQSQGQLKVVHTAGEIKECIDNGILAAILHFEGAEAIDTDLDALEVFYRAGLRSLGPVWSRPNAFAEGVPFRYPHSPDTGPGLTDAGRELVRECNRLGIMIDLSHLNEQGFWDVARLSSAPLVATHSNVHAICAMTRNLTDRQLDAIRESDGIVGLNFGIGFVREDGGRDRDTPMETLVRHIDYMVERVGIDRVGLGSDFDGATMPYELDNVSMLPNLVAALRRAGYDDAALRKLGHENWLRVLRETWGS
jgi:membrane dipeptidase